jgi:hypothetical protein
LAKEAAMNRINDILGYLRDRIAEPGSQRALAVAFGLAGITVPDMAWQVALGCLTLLTTISAVLLREKATMVAAGSMTPISAIAFNTLTDLLGQGPALKGVAQQVYALHADGKLDANELLSILGGLNTVASGVATQEGVALASDPVIAAAAAPVVVVAAPPAPPAAVILPNSVAGPLSGAVGAVLLAIIGSITLSACATSPAATTTTKDVLAEADAAYQALAGFETVAGNFCTTSPTVAPCPSIPFAKIALVDQAVYADLTAANTASAQSNATGLSVALAGIDQQLPQALALIPTSTDPAINAAVAALKAAVTTFTTDLGAQS